MAEKKITRKEALIFAYNTIQAILESDGFHLEEDNKNAVKVQEVLANMWTSIDKQSKRPKSPSKTSIENDKLADDLVGEMVAYGAPVNTKWITEHVRYVTSSQKATAVCKVAIAKGDIIRTVDDKKHVWYSLAE